MTVSAVATTLFVDGDFQPAASGETLPVVDPATGTTAGAISAGGAQDVDRAVRSATAAFNGGWGRLGAADRGRLLARFGGAVAQHAERLSQLESEDTGKPISQARADLAATVRYFEYYAGGADKLHGDTIPYLPGYAVQVLRVPVGVTGHIIPWNYPAQMFARSLAPSLAAGNATVIKPSEDASRSIVELAKLVAECGFPAGAVNVVTGLGETAGDALARHPGVDVIGFTGSTEVGTLVQAAAAQHHARCILELGGKSAQIVFADADLDAAIPAIVRAIVQNGGQTCSAGSRVLIEACAFGQVAERLAAAFARLRIGLPASDPDVGPLINGAQFARVRGYVDRAAARCGRRSRAQQPARRSPGRRLLRRADAVRSGARTPRAGVRGSVRSGALCVDVRRRARCDPVGERDAVRSGGRRVDGERQPSDARGARASRRSSLHQLLRRRRRDRTAVRRFPQERTRPRQGLRSDARVQHPADDHAEVRMSSRDGALQGKIAVVTGGGSGFGAEIARKLAQEGASVTLLDVDEAGGTRVAGEVDALRPGSARFLRCDVSRHGDVAAAVRRIAGADGRIDVYVNNAGITHRNRPMLEVGEDWFDRIFAVNVKALFLSALELVPVFRAQGGGSIVNVASTAGIRPRPGLTVYNASKGAAIAFSKSMAVEFAPDNIRVNAVCPSPARRRCSPSSWAATRRSCARRSPPASRSDGCPSRETSRTRSRFWPPTKRRSSPESRSKSTAAAAFRDRLKSAIDERAAAIPGVWARETVPVWRDISARRNDDGGPVR